jgi:hypothetical protein
MSELRHFKLANGDEIICEVVEWSTEESSEIIVRNAMSIVSFTVKGDKYYTFRPWMVFQSDSQYFQMLNHDHVLAEALPALQIIEQYKKALLVENDKEDRNIEDLINNLKDQLMSIHEGPPDMDSSNSNILQFNVDKSKLH